MCPLFDVLVNCAGIINYTVFRKQTHLFPTMTADQLRTLQQHPQSFLEIWWTYSVKHLHHMMFSKRFLGIISVTPQFSEYILHEGLYGLVKVKVILASHNAVMTADCLLREKAKRYWYTANKTKGWVRFRLRQDTASRSLTKGVAGVHSSPWILTSTLRSVDWHVQHGALLLVTMHFILHFLSVITIYCRFIPCVL